MAAHVVVHQISCIRSSMKRKRKKAGSRKGRSPISRTRRSVEDIFRCLGPLYFHRSYRMSYESFLILHEKVKDGIVRAASQAAPKRRDNEGGGNVDRREGVSPSFLLVILPIIRSSKRLQITFEWPVLLSLRIVQGRLMVS